MDALRLTTIFLRPSSPFVEGSLTVALYESNQPNGTPSDTPVVAPVTVSDFHPGGMSVSLPLPNVPLDQLWITIAGAVTAGMAGAIGYHSLPSHGTAIAPPPSQGLPPRISLAGLAARDGVSGRLEGADDGEPLHQGDGYPPYAVGFWGLDLVDVAAAPAAPSGLSVG